MPMSSTKSPSDKNAEARQQAAIVEWARLVMPQCIIYHVPNGGFRTKPEAARLKWMGVYPGITDLVIVDEPGFSYFMEVKGPDGVLSADQKTFRDLCLTKKWPWGIVHNVTEASALVNKWGIPTREAKR